MEIKFDRDEIKKAIVEQCMFEMYGVDTDEGCRIDYLYNMVRDEVTKQYKEMIHEKVIDHIEKMVPPLLNELIDRPYQPIDEYGEPRGPQKTIREAMKDKMSVIWEEKVDAKDGSRSSYGGIQRIEYLARRVVKHYFEEELNKDLSSTIRNLEETFKDSIIDSVTGLLTAKLFKK